MKEKLRCIINAYLAFIIYIFDRKKKSDNIWIFGGHNGDLFDDNSRVFYEYILSNKVEISPYWIINKQSIAKEDIEGVGGKYLIKGSIKNYLYFYKSSVAIFSHALSSDVLPYSYILIGLKMMQRKVYKVFLSHGVEGFKCITFSKNKYTHKLQDKMIKDYDLVLSVGEKDKEIKVNHWGLDKENISIIGMPRYDNLNYKKYTQKREILFMPTWRSWLYKSNKSITESDYYKNIIELITDKKLLSILEEKNVKMNVYIHHFMQEYINSFNIDLSENIKMLPINTSLQQKIIESSLIITDYSSISWDAAYMKKNILFYRFDIERYERETGSYLDLTKNILGDISFTKDELIYKLKTIIAENFEDKKIDNTMIGQYFKYRDNQNCKRVFEKIEEYLIKNKVI